LATNTGLLNCQINKRISSGMLADSAPLPDSPAPVGGQTLDDMEKATIEQALRENQGNISHAAKTLGLTRASLYRRIEKFGI
jgi:transcriptional regulator of acetoin/glycerol metabolism